MAINRFFQRLLLDKKYIRIEKTDFWFATEDDILLIGGISHKDRDETKIDYSINNKLNLKLSLDDTPNFSDIETLIGYYKYIPSDRAFRGNYFSLNHNRYEPIQKFNKRDFNSEDAIRPYVEMTINKPDELDEISRVISNIYPDLGKIYISLDQDGQNGKLIAIINNFAVPFDLLSSGVQQLVSFISQIYFSKNSLILIDEPELHMNPRMIVEISRLIQQSSLKNNNQFIIGTHSPSLISTPNNHIIPLRYEHDKYGYSTVVSKNVSNEFVDKSFLIKED